MSLFRPICAKSDTSTPVALTAAALVYSDNHEPWRFRTVDTADAVTGNVGSGVETLAVDGTNVGTHTMESDPNPLTYSKTFTLETAGTAIGASAEDFAGNISTDSLTVRLDKTAPTISGAATTNANANGWYNGPSRSTGLALTRCPGSTACARYTWGTKRRAQRRAQRRACCHGQDM